jgi:hypothetical protein
MMAYSQEVADAICARLAEGESLRAICRTEGMPSETRVRAWALDDVRGFSAQYARAREIGYQAMAEEIIAISDDSSGDTIQTEQGERPNTEFVSRSRLRVDSRKWMLSKMLPKVFGDKLELQHKGRIAVAKELSDDELANIAAGSGSGVAGPTPGA